MSCSARLRERGFTTRTIAVGSLGGVAAAERGECDLAPVHLVDPASGVYNAHLLRPGLALVKGWQRMQGFVHRADDPRFAGTSAAEALAAALADQHCLMVNRNAGAGTRVLIDQLLGGARPAGYSNQPRSHNAVAAAVAQGRADWGYRDRAGRQALRAGFPSDHARGLRFSAGRKPARPPGGAGVPRRVARRERARENPRARHAVAAWSRAQCGRSRTLDSRTSSRACADRRF